jgi:hypothetical protein
MNDMQNIEALYSTYATNSSNNVAIDFEAKLSQYKDQFSITITDTEIIFGEGKESISSLLQRNVLAIVDEPEYVYIILHASMFILCKNTGEVKENIRNL